MILPSKEKCTGCSACAAVCPKDAIVMQPDAFGFFHPEVKENICISCGRCTSVCPTIKKPEEGTEAGLFAAYCKNTQERRESSSGGIFGVLAGWILQQGGAVYGVSYDECFRVRHIRITELAEISRLKGAKYAQSDLGHTFRSAQADLRQGKWVLFCGTPCQIAGLNNLIGTNRTRLVTVDLVCHSVPAPAAWERYMADRQKQDGQISPPSAVFQRSKKTGWVNYAYCSRFIYSDGRESLIPAGQDAYMKAFTEGMISNPACGSCPAKGLQRSSDFTLGDFWGVEKLGLDMDVLDGVSAVMVHTNQGIGLWNAVQDRIASIAVTPEQILFQNPAILKSASITDEQKIYLQTICEEGFDKLPLTTVPRDNGRFSLQTIKQIVKTALDRFRQDGVDKT